LSSEFPTTLYAVLKRFSAVQLGRGGNFWSSFVHGMLKLMRFASELTLLKKNVKS
jgi:hypothetical protein